MTRNVIACFADETMEEMAQRMKRYQLRGCPVVSRDDQCLVGIVLGASETLWTTTASGCV